MRQASGNINKTFSFIFHSSGLSGVKTNIWLSGSNMFSNVQYDDNRRGMNKYEEILVMVIIMLAYKPGDLFVVLWIENYIEQA